MPHVKPIPFSKKIKHTKKTPKGARSGTCAMESKIIHSSTGPGRWGSMLLGKQAISATKATPLTVALSESENDHILVIIRLEGGNDGLNTIVPVYDFDTYVNLRPTIHHEQKQPFESQSRFRDPQLHECPRIGLGQWSHESGAWGRIPEQNLSLFAPTDIWATAADTYVEPTGWWGRYFEDLYPDYLINPPEVPPAVQVGNIGNLILMAIMPTTPSP